MMTNAMGKRPAEKGGRKLRLLKENITKMGVAREESKRQM